MSTRLRGYLRRFGDRHTALSDLKAGVTLGVESVPDGLAAGVLAGVNPLFGLNAYVMGTLVGALTTGSVFMTVQATGAMSVIIADVPEVQGPEPAGAMAMLGLLTGVIMLGLGIARLGSLVRFIPAVVLIGFVNAVAINIVLGQLDNFTGFESTGANRIVRAVDSALGLPHYHWASVLVGAVTVTLILLLERTRLGALALVVAVIAGSALAWLLPAGDVAILGDTAEVTRALPLPVLPDLSLIVNLLVPAVSLALVGLVQGAAISGSIPNPNGQYPDASADFRGQGMANLASGVFQGMPVGGSMSATALSRAAGAKSALAGVVAAAVMIVTILVCGPAIEFIAMPALAGLLILVGVRTLKIAQIALVWRTGPTQIAVFLVTFVGTLVIPLQYAVLAGVGLSIVLHVARQSNRVRLARWVFDDAPADSQGRVPGRPLETEAPARIEAGETVVLVAYGSLFFASAQALRAQLPTPDGPADGAFAVLRLRGTEELGVTFLTMIREYAQELRNSGATLMLAGVDERLGTQLRATGVIDELGAENVFARHPRIGDSLAEALTEIDRRRAAHS